MWKPQLIGPQVNVITGGRLSVSAFPDNMLREMSKRGDIPTLLISAIP